MRLVSGMEINGKRALNIQSDICPSMLFNRAYCAYIMTNLGSFPARLTASNFDPSRGELCAQYCAKINASGQVSEAGFSSDGVAYALKAQFEPFEINSGVVLTAVLRAAPSGSGWAFAAGDNGLVRALLGAEKLIDDFEIALDFKPCADTVSVPETGAAVKAHTDLNTFSVSAQFDGVYARRAVLKYCQKSVMTLDITDESITQLAAQGLDANYTYTYARDNCTALTLNTGGGAPINEQWNDILYGGAVLLDDAAFTGVKSLCRDSGGKHLGLIKEGCITVVDAKSLEAVALQPYSGGKIMLSNGAAGILNPPYFTLATSDGKRTKKLVEGNAGALAYYGGAYHLGTASDRNFYRYVTNSSMQFELSGQESVSGAAVFEMFNRFICYASQGAAGCFDINGKHSFLSGWLNKGESEVKDVCGGIADCGNYALNLYNLKRTQGGLRYSNGLMISGTQIYAPAQNDAVVKILTAEEEITDAATADGFLFVCFKSGRVARYALVSCAARSLCYYLTDYYNINVRVTDKQSRAVNNIKINLGINLKEEN